MKKVLKITLILLILLAITTILPMSKSNATDILGDARTWFDQARSGGSHLIDPNNVVASLKPIAQILFWAGVITLVIAYPVMGIKYMVSEPDKKADLKTKLIGLVIASVVILGAYGIWKITYLFMSELIR